jgi:glutathione S-transferase
MLTLLHTLGSPFARKVRIVLADNYHNRFTPPAT